MWNIDNKKLWSPGVSRELQIFRPFKNKTFQKNAIFKGIAEGGPLNYLRGFKKAKPLHIGV